jgi:putative oxidoreductase
LHAAVSLGFTGPLHRATRRLERIGARVAAAAVLAMTVTIKLFVCPGSYPDHLLWAEPPLHLIRCGPGFPSLDHLVRRRLI